MSESHGTILILKRHEDLEKVAAYVLKTEANKGEPLFYALRQAFTNLDVEIKETEW